MINLHVFCGRLDDICLDAPPQTFQPDHDEAIEQFNWIVKILNDLDLI